MAHPLATAVLWLGRALMLLAVLLVVGTLFAPEQVQFLNPLVCPDPGSLVNHRPGEDRLEVLCRMPYGVEPAGARVAGLVGAFVIGAALCFAMHARWRRSARRGPHAH